MSKCISRAGEFGSHELDPTFTCTVCGAADDDALLEAYLGLRRRHSEFRAAVDNLRLALEYGGRIGIEDAHDALFKLLDGK